jgi:hypothetical protein
MPRTSTGSLQNRRHRVLRPKLSKIRHPQRMVFLMLNHQTAVSIAQCAHPPCPGHVSHQFSTVPATRLTPPHPRTSACPRCQPLWLVTRLLWSVSQDSALFLHRSRYISTSPLHVHLICRPPFMCSTPTHHKLSHPVLRAKPNA